MSGGGKGATFRRALALHFPRGQAGWHVPVFPKTISLLLDNPDLFKSAPLRFLLVRSPSHPHLGDPSPRRSFQYFGPPV